jgi:N-acetylglucosamine kinase-like BadF-type ATPase
MSGVGSGSVDLGTGHPGDHPGTGRLALGIDAGGSSTRWLLVDEAGEHRGAGRVGPVSAIDLPHDPSAELVAGSDDPTIANLEALAKAVLAAGAPSFVLAGVTGLDTLSPEAVRLEGFLANLLAVPVQSVRVLGDIATAYLASFAPGMGVLVYAGTGSVAVHIATDGTLVRAGGHGYLIDDGGGGFWIGREALRRVLRIADESGGPAGGVLAAAIYADMGGSDWPTIRRTVYGGGRSRVAALTPIVARAASRGDQDALAVLAGAGAELARLAGIVCGRLGQVLPVALAGGVAQCGAPLLKALAASVPAGASVSVATTSPVEAAAAVARQLAAGEAALPAPWLPS